jgi:hypothetical protein
MCEKSTELYKNSIPFFVPKLFVRLFRNDPMLYVLFEILIIRAPANFASSNLCTKVDGLAQLPAMTLMTVISDFD